MTTRLSIWPLSSSSSLFKRNFDLLGLIALNNRILFDRLGTPWLELALAPSEEPPDQASQRAHLLGFEEYRHSQENRRRYYKRRTDLQELFPERRRPHVLPAGPGRNPGRAAHDGGRQDYLGQRARDPLAVQASQALAQD